MTCSSCGATVPERARFCPSCGNPLDVRADERRVVTVVFGDLVGFTTLSETRDPEHIKNLVDRCFAQLALDVTNHGGRVDKVLGDGIIALFGAPLAHEDDAERAVRCALQMQQTLGAYARDASMPIQMRVGVNTGEVLVGALRAGGDSTAMGDVVNTASRLQEAAAPGQVLVGPATYAATRNVLRYDHVGALSVKGRVEPVEAWRALEAIAPPGHRPRRARTPLVGRDAEVAILRRAVEMAAERSRAQLLLLIGEAGVGKSRLAEELAAIAALDHGGLVLEGRCVPYGEANGWWPIAEAIRRSACIDAEAEIDEAERRLRSFGAELFADQPEGEVVRLTDGLLSILGHGTLGRVEPSRAREEAIRSALSLFEALARTRPLTLVISELHWADEVVLHLADRLLDRLRALPFVLVATARPELEERWTPKPGRHNLVLVNLDPLDARAADDLLTSLLGHDAPADLRELLLERGGGNPFFLEELVALLTEAGVMQPDGAARRLRADGQDIRELPATLRGIVAARLDRLDPRERGVLEDASVLGRHGQVDALIALASARGETDAASVIDELAAKDFLVAIAGECEFKSDVVREVAYGTLTKAERARRHAALGVWIDVKGRKMERADDYLQQVAHHYGSAAEIAVELGGVEGVPADIGEVALESLLRAIEAVEHREAWQMAGHLVEQALKLVTDDATRWNLLLTRAKARSGVRNMAGARDDVETVLVEADATGAREVHARALVCLGAVERAEGDLAASAATLELAVTLWREQADRKGVADALRELGFTWLLQGRHDASEDAIQQALDAFRDLGDRRGEAWALQNLAWIAFERGQVDHAEERLHESMTAFAEIGDWGGAGWAMGLLGWVRYWQGRLDEAHRLAEAILDEAHRTGERFAEAMMVMLLANISLWRGDPDDAVLRAREALRIFETIGDHRYGVQANVPLIRGLVMSGRVGEALAMLEAGLGVIEVQSPDVRKSLGAVVAAQTFLHAGHGEAGLREAEVVDAQAVIRSSEWTIMLGLGLLQCGRVADAVARLEEASALARVDGASANARSALALAYAAAGRAEEALREAGEVKALPVGSFLDRMFASLAQGFAAGQQGDATAADTAFADAAAILAETADRYDAALIRLAYGHALDARGDPSGRETLDAARTELAGMQADPVGWETAFLLAARGGVPG
jgi:class 3 adenylate cyclase/tetratricopeptide (TPR) repeat protein